MDSETLQIHQTKIHIAQLHSAYPEEVQQRLDEMQQLCKLENEQDSFVALDGVWAGRPHMVSIEG